MSRWLLLLLAVVGGAIVAYVTVLVAVGGIVGLLWVFVFGDDTWPKGWEIGVAVTATVMGFGTWFMVAREIWLRFST